MHLNTTTVVILWNLQERPLFPSFPNFYFLLLIKAVFTESQEVSLPLFCFVCVVGLHMVVLRNYSCLCAQEWLYAVLRELCIKSVFNQNYDWKRHFNARVLLDCLVIRGLLFIRRHSEKKRECETGKRRRKGKRQRVTHTKNHTT